MSTAALMDVNNGFYNNLDDSVIFRVEITVIGELESVTSANAYLVDSEHKYTLQNSLISLMYDAELSDTTIEVGNEVFNVHKSILCSRSSVFRAMLCKGNFSEAQCGTIKLQDVSADIVRELIYFIYTDMLSPSFNLEENVVPLFAASMQFEIKGVTKICENVFINKLNIDNAIQVLKVADTYSSKSLKDQVFQFIAQNAQSIKKQKDFLELEGDLLQETNIVLEFSFRRNGCSIDSGDKRHVCTIS